MNQSFLVHESSYINDEVSIGINTKIWHFCHVLPQTSIGQNCNIGQNVVDPDVSKPATAHGWVCECGKKFDEAFVCPTCGLRYWQGPQGLASSS